MTQGAGAPLAGMRPRGMRPDADSTIPFQARPQRGGRMTQGAGAGATRSRGPTRGDATVEPAKARLDRPSRVYGVRSPEGPLFRPPTRPLAGMRPRRAGRWSRFTALPGCDPAGAQRARAFRRAASRSAVASPPRGGAPAPRCAGAMRPDADSTIPFQARPQRGGRMTQGAGAGATRRGADATTASWPARLEEAAA